MLHDKVDEREKEKEKKTDMITREKEDILKKKNEHEIYIEKIEGDI